MNKEKGASLKQFNTFGLECKAHTLLRVQKSEDLKELPDILGQSQVKPLVLGGGSNLLLPNELNRLVIKNELLGLGIVEEDSHDALVYAAGGVSWHALVCFALDHQLGGIENLALIPGTAGAAPIQNIGAYGVELKDTFHSLEAWSLSEGVLKSFSKQACDFGYRDSVFKRGEYGKWLITGIYMKLSKNSELQLSYGAIQSQLSYKKINTPSIRDVAEAVMDIRRSKLPDPAQIGNAGSFFKNPEIPESQFRALKEAYPEIVAYPQASGLIKIAAGWLIETCGWKGHDRGGFGVHDRQALVLVNKGGGTGDQLIALAKDIVDSVRNSFGIELETEVNILQDG